MDKLLIDLDSDNLASKAIYRVSNITGNSNFDGLI